MILSAKKVALWLAVVVGLCYFGSMNGEFHFDDSHSVEGNVAIRSLSNIPSFWIDPKTSSFIPDNRVYRPMVYVGYALAWQLGGGETWAFHLFKIAMHVVVCLMLFLIWRRLWQEPGWFLSKPLSIHFPFTSKAFEVDGEKAALLLAFLFAVHPTGSECVDYISATTSLQCAMFFLLGFNSYLQYRDSGRRKYFVWLLVYYFLSVASKEEGITLPAMILITELMLSSANTATRARAAAPGEANSSRTQDLNKWLRHKLLPAVKFTLPVALFGVVLAAWILLMRPDEGRVSRGFISSYSYFLTQWRAYLWYMRLWFWPWDLNADYVTVTWSNSLTEAPVIQAAIGNALVLALAWFNRKKFPALLYGVLWFYVTIAPASSVVVLAEAINEHRMYLSYIGFAGGTFVILLAAAQTLMSNEGRARWLGWIYAVVFVGLVIGTQERNRVWANGENLWVDTLAKNPGSGRAMNNLALVYMARADYKKAVDLLEQCERSWTTYAHCPLNRGVSLMALKNYDEAEKALLRAIQLSPNSVYTTFHLAQLYNEKKDFEKAIQYYQKSVDLTGGRYPAADINLSIIFRSLKRFDEGRRVLARALSVEPRSDMALFHLGGLELDAGKTSDAIQAYERLVAAHPAHVQGWYNLGVARLATGDPSRALQAFRKTVELDPKSEQGWYNLAFVAEKAGRWGDVVQALERLSSINPAKAEYGERLRNARARATGAPAHSAAKGST